MVGKAQGVFRRFENNELRLANFGSDMSGVLGYYRPHWFVAAEFGFDKAIVTHFKHSKMLREWYPEIVDGWYERATGGTYNYGLQAGVSFKRSDITVRAGKTIEQDLKTKPIIPFYFQLGYNVKF